MHANSTDYALQPCDSKAFEQTLSMLPPSEACGLIDAGVGLRLNATPGTVF